MKFLNDLRKDNPALLIAIYDRSGDLLRLLTEIDDDRLISLKQALKQIRTEVDISGLQSNIQGTGFYDKKPGYLDLRDDFTYTKPSGFKMGEDFFVEINYYRDLYIEILKLLAHKDPERFEKLPDKSFVNGRIRPYFSKIEKNMNNPVLIYSVYCETHFTSNGIRDMILKLFDIFDIDPSIFSVQIRRDNKYKYRYYSR